MPAFELRVSTRVTPFSGTVAVMDAPKVDVVGDAETAGDQSSDDEVVAPSASRTVIVNVGETESSPVPTVFRSSAKWKVYVPGWVALRNVSFESTTGGVPSTEKAALTAAV